MAYNLAFSIKHFNPNLRIGLMHDDNIRYLQAYEKTVFDDFYELPQDLLWKEGRLDPANIKINLYDLIPYDETLYLDVDAVVTQDISRIFEEQTGNYYIHILDETTLEKGRDFPNMIWAWMDDVYEHFNLKPETKFPATNSSIQLIRKGEYCEHFFARLKENYNNPLPLNKLRSTWGQSQPDELYINVTLAQMGYERLKQYIFFGHTFAKQKDAELLKEYLILSIYGGWGVTRLRYVELYDRLLGRNYFRAHKMNYIHRSNNLIRPKHSNKSSKPAKKEVVSEIKKLGRDDNAKTGEQITLFTTYYKDEKESRNKEYLNCLQANISNPEIDRIVIICESDLPVKHKKVTEIPSDHRPTFKDIFRLTGDGINIVTNADIFFESSHCNYIKQLNFDNLFLGLSRWDRRHGKDILFNYGLSQDVWIFKGKYKDDTHGDYTFGSPGCDNRIAYEAGKAYGKIINPAKTIKSIHLHESNVRNYTQDNRVVGDYRELPPVILSETLFKPRLMIIQKGKVGDVLVLLPAIKELSKTHVVDWLLPEQYHTMFQYINYCKPIEKTIAQYEKKIDLSFGQGGQPEAWWQKNKTRFNSFVEAKYELLCMDVQIKKNLLEWNRNKEREEELFAKVVTTEPYALVHCESDYGGAIEPETELPIVLFQPTGNHTVFDWLKVVENAAEIHCIDSSLCNFTDMVKTTGKLFYYPNGKVPSQYDRTLLSKTWKECDSQKIFA